MHLKIFHTFYKYFCTIIVLEQILGKNVTTQNTFLIQSLHTGLGLVRELPRKKTQRIYGNRMASNRRFPSFVWQVSKSKNSFKSFKKKCNLYKKVIYLKERTKTNW